MMEVTAKMPMKQINIERAGADCIQVAEGYGHTPYLQRYFAGTFRDNVDLWLHRFISGDPELHLHSHGFNFKTVMLVNSYSEEYAGENGTEWNTVTPPLNNDMATIIDAYASRINAPIHMARPTSSHFLHSNCDEYLERNVFDWHRIVSAEPNTWTAVLVEAPRLPMWFFKNDEGDLEPRTSSPRDWYKNYNHRPQTGICEGNNDNRKSRS